jgi:hypothetical protein
VDKQHRVIFKKFAYILSNAFSAKIAHMTILLGARTFLQIICQRQIFYIF